MSEPSTQPPPHAALMQMLAGKIIAAAIGTVAKFAIADHLASGPKSVAELAAATGTHAPSLYRLLRTTASLGVFTELEDGRFAQTPLSEPLRTNAEPGLRNIAMMFLDEWHMRVWEELPWSVQTGRPAPYRVWGKPIWEVLADRPDQSVNFNAGMTDMSTVDAPAVAAAYDFSVFRTIVDVGGGMGYLLASILRVTPALRGTLFDMPSVIEQARQSPILQPFADRVRLEAGSFFDHVPAGADAYVMKHIIHDWDDEHSQKILRNCRNHLTTQGRLLVVDQVVEPRNQPGFAKILDIEMLVAPGGLERTEEQWSGLLAASGFRLNRIVRTQSPQCIMEGIPV